MRIIALFIIGILVHSSLYCQIDTTINLIPHWKKGEIKKYEIKRYTSVDAENERKENNLITKEIDIQVVEVEKNVLVMNWRVENLSYSDTISTEDPLTKLVNSLDKDISVKYTINKNGNIIDLINLDEITNIIKTRIGNALNKFISENNIDKSKADMLIFQFTMMYSTQEQIKSIVLNDLNKFHQIYGFSYTENHETIIPDNNFAPNYDGQPSNNLNLMFSNFDSNSRIINLEGELRSSEINLKQREFIEKGRTVKYTYMFKYPENWLISYKETIKSNGGYVDLNSVTEINLIE